jgi:hypothetical protein
MRCGKGHAPSHKTLREEAARTLSVDRYVLTSRAQSEVQVEFFEGYGNNDRQFQPHRSSGRGALSIPEWLIPTIEGCFLISPTTEQPHLA